MAKAQQATADCDTYEPMLCLRCQQLRSVKQTRGEVIGRGRVGAMRGDIAPKPKERRTSPPMFATAHDSAIALLKT
jgi:hypothetical protein